VLIVVGFKTEVAVTPDPPPPEKLTAGFVVKPLPAAVRLREDTEAEARVAVAVAPVPPPPEIVMVGAEV
jgi:hypothetical protein